jgi:SSS family transporter
MFPVLLSILALGARPVAATELAWSPLPELPAAVSGHAAGVLGASMVVTGGSSFEVSPFQGGEKQYHDAIYHLPLGANAWVEAGRLPAPRAYAGSVVWNDALLLIGGHNAGHVFDDALLLRQGLDTVTVEPASIPSLPAPWTHGAAALVGDVLYVVGGQSTLQDTTAIDGGWRIDLTDPSQGWSPLPGWPGGGRILPVAVVQANVLHVFSGASLLAALDGKPTRQYLTDGYRLAADGSWLPCAATPVPMVAAPSVAHNTAHIVVFGGDDGAHFAETQTLGDAHPGFSRKAYAYHTITDTWTPWAGEAPGTVTAPALLWDNGFVIPGGEDRPGHRMASVAAAKRVTPHGRLSGIDYAVIVVYLGALVWIGAWFTRSEKSTEQYFLGGRRVPWWAVGLSIFGTSLSAITYLSIPAHAYATDWTNFLANLGILVVAPLVVLFYLPRFHQYPIHTAYEYLERRFHLALRIYGSLCFMLFQFGRVGIVLYLPAITLTAATGMNIYLCIALMGVLATVYTVLGGIEAVIWTDVVQSFVLVFGAVLALVIILLRVEGDPLTMAQTAWDAGKLHSFDWRLDYTAATVWVVLLGNAFSNLYPATADQTIVQRYLSTKDVPTAARAVWTNALLTLPVTLLFFSLGTALWLYFRQHPEVLDPDLRNDAILPLFVMAEFPVGLRGVLIAGIFAAAMSSLDSSINSVASVLVNDYYRRLARNVNEHRALIAARVITLVFGALGTGMAMYVARLESISLWEPFLALLGLVGGGLSGIFALGMFTTRANTPGALAGVAASALAVTYARTTDMHIFLYGMVGFLTAFVVGYVVSLPFGRRAPGPDSLSP